jgi:hypothetical protein
MIIKKTLIKFISKCLKINHIHSITMPSSTFGSVYHFSGTKITGHFRDVDISIRYVAECPTRIFHDFAKALKVEIKMSQQPVVEQQQLQWLRIDDWAALTQVRGANSGKFFGST